MSNIKYFIISAVLLAGLVFGTILFSGYAHDLYMDKALKRLSASSGGSLVIDEIAADDSLLSRLRSYALKYQGKKLSFTLTVKTSLTPFGEHNDFQLSNLDGELVTCPFCDMRDLRVDGSWNVQYFTNTFEGRFAQSNSNGFKSASEAGSLNISGITGDFRGSFGDAATHFGIKIDQILSENKATGFNTNIAFLVGDFDLKALPDLFLLNSKNFSMVRYESKNVKTGEKISVENASISVDAAPSAGSSGLADMKVDVAVRSYEHDNPSWTNDFHVEKNVLNLRAAGVDQTFWIDFIATAKNLFRMGEKGVSFDFDNLRNLMRTRGALFVDRMQLISKDSKGFLKIEKGGEITFASGKKDVKDAINMTLKFKVNDAFINDMPNGGKYKQQFLNNEWLVISNMNSKDEYSSQLSVKFGQCSVGENLLDDC